MKKKKVIKKIAHFGAFNHDSYGDLIFPHIVEHFLDEFEIIHVSPSRSATKWVDQKKIISVDQAIKKNDWDGILVGGGDLIHSPKDFIWKKNIYQKYGALSSLWCGASLLSAKLGIPCVWNSPGVPYNISLDENTLSRDALDCVEFISVRDTLSRDNLKNIKNKDIYVSPDSAILLSHIWPKSKIQHEYITVSLTNEDLIGKKEDIKQLFSKITDSKDLPNKIIVLPLMAWRGFDESEELSKFREEFDIDVFERASSLYDCAMVISASSAYIGNSLHGLITAVSYGVPACIVKPVGFENVLKYEGFSSHFYNPNFIAENFIEALNIVSKKNIPNITNLKESVIEKFDLIKLIFTKNNNLVDKNKKWEKLILNSSSKNEKFILYGLDIRKIVNDNNRQIENLKLDLESKLEECNKEIDKLHISNNKTETENRIKIMKIDIEDLNNRIFDLVQSNNEIAKELKNL